MFYAVTGRVLGDDGDVVASVGQQDSYDAAVEAFKKWVLASRKVNGREIVAHMVMVSESPIVMADPTQVKTLSAQNASAEEVAIAWEARVPLIGVVDVGTFNQLVRELDGCGGMRVHRDEPGGSKPGVELGDEQIHVLIEAVVLQQEGKPPVNAGVVGFQSDEKLIPELLTMLKDSGEVRLDIGGSIRHRYLEDEEVAAIVGSLERMQRARKPSALNDGITDHGEVLYANYYSQGYPWQIGYDQQVSGVSVSQAGKDVVATHDKYNVDGAKLRDAIRHAEIVGDLVPSSAYQTLKTLTWAHHYDPLWRSDEFREAIRRQEKVAHDPRLKGLPVASVNAKTIGEFQIATGRDIREDLKSVCADLSIRNVGRLDGIEAIMTSEEFEYQILRQASGALSYVQYKESSPVEAFMKDYWEALKMWSIAALAQDHPHIVTSINPDWRIGEDRFYGGVFGPGAAKWEPATSIRGGLLAADYVDGAGLRHAVLFSHQSRSVAQQKEAANEIRRFSSDKELAPADTFGSILIERGLPMRISNALSHQLLATLDSLDRIVCSEGFLGFPAGTSLNEIAGWVSSHAEPGALVELQAVKPVASISLDR